MIHRTIFYAIAVLFGLASCQSSQYGDYQTTKDGLRYKIHTSTSGKTAKVGDMLKIHKTTYSEGDSLISSTHQKGKPVEIIIDTQKVHTPILKQLKVGDSVTILEHTDSIIGTSDPKNFPGYLRNNKYIKKSLTVVDHIAEGKLKHVNDKKLSKQTKKDIKTIKKHLKKEGIDAKSTRSGIYYTSEQTGQGTAPQAGDTVMIHLTATVMNGPKYYSTQDVGSPIDFVVGKNPLVPALNEICKSLKPGGQGTFYIPSPLAFGKSGKGNKVPPNAIMIFEVKLMKVQQGPSV